MTLAFAARGDFRCGEVASYIVAQIDGGVAGAIVAHAMFQQPLVDFSLKIRTGLPQWFAEGVVTFGLLATLLGGLRFNPAAIPWLVGLYITAAYWFTASTSFANRAVAVARSFSNTFSGIRPIEVPGFIFAQLIGAGFAVALFGWLLGQLGQPLSNELRKTDRDV